MLPHLGQPRIWPMAAASRTFSLALQVVQVMVKSTIATTSPRFDLRSGIEAALLLFEFRWQFFASLRHARAGHDVKDFSPPPSLGLMT